MASLHGWRAVLFSPEMPTVPHLRDKLRRIRGGSRLEADNFIDEYFRFIDADPTGREDVDFDLDWIIDKATDAVLRDGIRVLVIDPWTRLSMRGPRRIGHGLHRPWHPGPQAVRATLRRGRDRCRPSDERCWPRWESSATNALRHRGVSPLVQ
jgi:hypothetical protein